MTELEAINLMLEQGAGLTPVNSVAGRQALKAKTDLDRRRKEILAQGWHFNTDTIDLVAATDKTVAILDNYLAVRLPCPFVYRQKKVYDPTKRTYEVDQDFLQTLVAVQIDYNDIPLTVATYIAWAAAFEYSKKTLGARSDQAQECRRNRNAYRIQVGIEYPAHHTSQYGADATLVAAGGSDPSRSPGVNSSACGSRWCKCA